MKSRSVVVNIAVENACGNLALPLKVRLKGNLVQISDVKDVVNLNFKVGTGIGAAAYLRKGIKSPILTNIGTGANQYLNEIITPVRYVA